MNGSLQPAISICGLTLSYLSSNEKKKAAGALSTGGAVFTVEEAGRGAPELILAAVELGGT